MFTMYGNSKTIWERTPEEQKVCLIIVGIMALALIVYGVYYFFKSKKDK